jgi:sn-glycerol 3-phosphate transport system permease protein
MVENRPFLNFLTHLVLITGIAMVVFPVYLAFIASTRGPSDFLTGVVPLTPGHEMLKNYGTLLGSGASNAGAPPFLLMLGNSLVMAILVAVGKIAISIISAFAIVYFRFPFRTSPSGSSS